MKRLLALKLFFFLLIPSLFGQIKRKMVQAGRASFYADRFHGKRTASGERFNTHGMTAAHRTLPFGTVVRVTNPANGKYVTVRVNDRGPHARNRVIDLTKAAAKRLGLTVMGAQMVLIQPVAAGQAWFVDEPVRDTVSKTPQLATAECFPTGGSYRPDGTPVQPQGFALQVGSYYSYESALYEAAALAQAGYKDVYVQVPCTEGREPIYRIMVGEYSTRDRAMAVKPKLSGKGWDSIPVKHI